MRHQKMSPIVERTVLMLAGIGCSIWILRYDIILLVPVLGLIACTRELNGLNNIGNKP